ncbi:MAG: VWA domain-containing protein [Candidatus Kapaibacteriales bacterium]
MNRMEKNRMFKSVLVLLLSFFFLKEMLSQDATFTISEIDASEFPLVRAGFIALDATGQAYNNLGPNDFDVLEDGKSMNSRLTVECKDTIVEPKVSIVLVVDQSNSMLISMEGGETRWNWVIQGVTAFVNEINFRTGTKVALISFGRYAFLRCNFTSNKQEIIDSLNNTSVGGATLYNPPFLDPENGAINLFVNGSPDPKIRRIVVFLTDGDPNEPPATDSIIKELQKTNIQVYSITLAMPMNRHLAEISSKTGGGSYAVYTKDELENIYKFIALDIQKKQLCQLTWVTDYGCDPSHLTRNVSITFKRQGVTINRLYEAPKNSIAKLNIDQSIFDFLDPAPNQSNDLDIQIGSNQVDYFIKDIKIIPTTFFQIISWDVNGNGGPPPFTIPKGESRTIRVRFTQGSVRTYREATLVIDASPCASNSKLIGGISQIRIVHPNGGEIFSVCDTINIIWSGVEKTKPVNLFYSSDGGSTWRSLASNITGLSYKWIPPTGGNSFRIKGTVAPLYSYTFLKSLGGSENDFGRSIAVTYDNSYFYITGSFTGTMELENGRKLTSAGNLDVFVIKYDRDGNLIWAQSAGGYGIDTASGICVDKNGNAYVVGTCFQTAQFGNISPNIPIANSPYCFIAKFPASGSTPVVTLLGADNVYTSFKAWGQKIKYVVNQPLQSDEIVVIGGYINSISNAFYTLPKVTVETPFTASLYPDMSFKLVQKGATDDGSFSKNFAIDGGGDRYEVGSFQGNLARGNLSVSSRGKNDVFISKYAGTPGSEDVSDTTFEVQNPIWQFVSQNFVFGDCTLGLSIDSAHGSFVCNVGNVPIVITNTQFIGTNFKDFSLGFQLIGRRINPGECLPIEIIFHPTDIGVRTAQLVVTPDCGTPIVLTLKGNGVCSGTSLQKVEFPPENLNAKREILVKCIFTNTNPASIPVKLVLYGPNSSDFSLEFYNTIVPPDSCFDLKVMFIPSGVGLRQAFIRFELPEGCESPVTELNGIGVDADILVSSVDWEGRRILTRNDSNIIVVNRSSILQKLTYVDFESPQQNFVFANNPPVNLPALISPNDTLLIPVSFIPTEEKSYSTTVILKFEGLLSELITNLRGDGILPKIELNWNCLDAIKPGEEGRAELEVVNPSTTSDLFIYEMDFKYKTGDFDWVNGQPKNIAIPKSSNKIFEIKFTPKTAGTRADLIKITHDAVPGPEKYPKVDTLFDAQCDGLGLQTRATIDFENSLLCVENVYNLQVNNDSWLTPITIQSYFFSNEDGEAFEIMANFPLIIPPSNFVSIPIKFSPRELKPYSTTLTFITSIDNDLNINLIGNGIPVDFYSDEKEMELFPYFSRRAIVKASIPKLYQNVITKMLLNIRYYEKMIKIDSIVPANKLANWTWSLPNEIDKGLVQVIGNGLINPPFNDEIFTIYFTIFLSDVKESPIEVELVSEGCNQPFDEVAKIILTGVCFLEGRLITIGELPFALYGPEENPVKGSTSFQFSIPFDEKVILDVFDSYGNLIKVLLDEPLKAGEYNLHFDPSDIPSGLYFVRMTAGRFTDLRSFVVIK